MALFELPPLPLELVFSGLEAEDRRRLPLVCRAARQACLHHPALSQRLTVRPSALAALPTGGGSWRAHLAARGCHTTELTFQGSANGLGDLQIAQLLPLFPHTRSLTLDGCLAGKVVTLLSTMPGALPALHRMELRAYRRYTWDGTVHFFTFDGFTPSCKVPPQGYDLTWDSLHLPMEPAAEHSMHSTLLSELSRMASRLHSLALLAPRLDLDVVGEHLAPLTGLTELRLGGVGHVWDDYDSEDEDWDALIALTKDEDWLWDALQPLTNLRRLTLEAQLGQNSDDPATIHLRCCVVYGDGSPAAAFPLASLSHLTFLSFVGSNRPSPALGQPRAWDLAGSEGNDGQLSAKLIVEGVSQLPALHELRMEGIMVAAPADLWRATSLTRLLLRNTYSSASVDKEDGEGSTIVGTSLPPLPSTGLRMAGLRELCLCGTIMPEGLLPALAGLTRLTALAVCNVDWEVLEAGPGPGQLSALSSLTGLQELNLSGSDGGCPLQVLEEVVGGLARLTTLRVLRLDGCKLGALPPHGPYASLESCFRNTKCDKDPWKVYARIASREKEQGKHSRLDRCSGLICSRVLTLARNSLKDCPADFLVTACPRLHTLDLSDNQDLPFSKGLLALARRSQGTRLRALYICPDSSYCWDETGSGFCWNKNDESLVGLLKSLCEPEEIIVLDGLLELWHAGQLRLGLGCSYAYDAAWPWRRRFL